MELNRNEIVEEFYFRHVKKNKDLFKKLVTPSTRKILETMEIDVEFIGSAEPYVASLLSFVTLMAEPEKILEIGTLIGYSTIITADCLSQNKNGKIFTVDPDTTKAEIAKKYVFQAGLENYTEFIAGKSQDPEVIDLLKKHAPFDLLFIDSLHNYNQTKEELRSLIRLVRHGGIIICHDSGLRAQDFDTEKQGGVRRALLEFTQDKKEFLFLDPPNWAPIGCFIMINKPSKPNQSEMSKKEKILEIISPYSILSEKRKSALFDCATMVNKNNVSGDFVECGVFNGGSAGILGALLEESDTNRKLWLFDSFEGLPEPTSTDISADGFKASKGLCIGSEKKVRNLIFDTLNLSPEQVKIAKGWYENTIPETSDKINEIAVLHLDCDWYESVKICMDYLFDKIQKGGYLVIDDYGYWQGCKKAIDEFFDKRGIELELTVIDDTGRYYQKK